MSTLPTSLFSQQASLALDAAGPGALRNHGATLHAKLEAGASADTPREHKLRQAAQQFESMLMNNLWKSMKGSFDDDDADGSDPALGTMQDWGMEAMAGAVGKAGGLGIAKLIMKDLAPKIDPPNGERGAV